MKNNCQLWYLEGTQKNTELKTKKKKYCSLRKYVSEEGNAEEAKGI